MAAYVHCRGAPLLLLPPFFPPGQRLLNTHRGHLSEPVDIRLQQSVSLTNDLLFTLCQSHPNFSATSETVRPRRPTWLVAHRHGTYSRRNSNSPAPSEEPFAPDGDKLTTSPQGWEALDPHVGHVPVVVLPWFRAAGMRLPAPLFAATTRGCSTACTAGKRRCAWARPGCWPRWRRSQGSGHCKEPGDRSLRNLGIRSSFPSVGGVVRNLALATGLVPFESLFPTPPQIPETRLVGFVTWEGQNWHKKEMAVQ